MVQDTEMLFTPYDRSMFLFLVAKFCSSTFRNGGRHWKCGTGKYGTNDVKFEGPKRRYWI